MPVTLRALTNAWGIWFNRRLKNSPPRNIRINAGVPLTTRAVSCGNSHALKNILFISPFSALASRRWTQNTLRVICRFHKRTPSRPMGMARVMASSGVALASMVMAVPYTPAMPILEGMVPPADIHPMYARLMVAPAISPRSGSPRIKPTTVPLISG